MTQWQPQQDPRRRDAQPPAIPSQFLSNSQPSHPHQPQQPQFTPQGQPPPGPSKPKGNAAKGCAFLGCGGLAAVVIAVALIVSHGGGSGSGSWKAHVENTVVINPADLAVAVQVTNAGKTAGAPTCTVKASDPSSAYTGFDEGTLTSPVQPGATTTYVDNVTITGQGAAYVTNVTVSC